MKNNKKLIKDLTEQGHQKKKEGYYGDATEKYFRANLLYYCEELVNHFKGIEKQMKYLWQELKELEEIEQEGKE